MQRLIDNWVYGGFLAGILLLGLFATIGGDWSTAFWLVALQLPIYMLHQYEEHDADRFRIFVNQLAGGGRDVLTRKAVFLINIPGVWGSISLPSPWPTLSIWVSGSSRFG